MAFMIGAYMVIWLAVFVFVFTMMRRERGLEAEIAALQEMASEKPAAH
jgi:CcmD family protein